MNERIRNKQLELTKTKKRKELLVGLFLLMLVD